MRGAMPCNPTQVWNRLSPTWQTRIRADLTALFQEVIDAQCRPDYAPTSGPQGRHLHPPIDPASGGEPSRNLVAETHGGGACHGPSRGAPGAARPLQGAAQE